MINQVNFLASTYNVSIRSYSDEFGEGGLNWIIGQTEIGIPEPTPPMPHILDVNDRTATIEIPPLVNNNGPISAIHVITVLVDSELLQKFDENLLKGYSEAFEDGTSYYITAQLPYEVWLTLITFFFSDADR